MRLEGCVRRDVMMDLVRPHAYCMLISIGLLIREMMSVDAHSMMMSANVHEHMRCMTLCGSANLWMSL